MYIINIETSTKVCGVSISKNGELLDSKESNEGNSHATNLSPFIDELLIRNGINYSDLSAIAISEGPGSYTGLRIGTSTAKGLCYSLDIPLIAISTLQSMAHHAKNNYSKDFKGIFRPMIDARRMEVYSQAFRNDLKAISEIKAIIIEDDSFANELEQQEVLFFEDNYFIFDNKIKDNYWYLNINLFEKNLNDSYTLYKEEHIELLHKNTEIKELLNLIGFNELKIISDYKIDHKGQKCNSRNYYILNK